MQKKFPKQPAPKVIRRAHYEDTEANRNPWWLYQRKRPKKEVKRITLTRRLETIQAQSKELGLAKEQGRKASTRLVKLPGGTYARIPND